MSVFSTNQARQLYVAKEVLTEIEDSASVGSISVGSDDAKGHLYFTHKGHGGITRSDLIDVKNIISAKVTPAAKMERDLKAVSVVLENAPVGGQDYLLKIVFRQFAGMSDEDIYTKYGMVHATNNMTESDFYKEMALSLVKNFSREAAALVKFSLMNSENVSTEVTTSTKEASLTGTYKALVITEVEQDWVLGVKPQEPVYFDVLPGVITANGDDVIWGKATEIDSNATVKNGKLIADLEYFCMGERADIHRGVGFPNSIPTKYLVDPTQEYDVLDIHYAYVGSNESVQKSEKDITIVAPAAVMTQIKSNIKDATGLNL